MGHACELESAEARVGGCSGAVSERAAAAASQEETQLQQVVAVELMFGGLAADCGWAHMLWRSGGEI
eukprot:824656-Rhodomonas_salina.2